MNISKYVYFLTSISKPGQVKIGRSNNVAVRLAALQSVSQIPLVLAGIVESYVGDLQLKLRGEWFPRTVMEKIWSI